MTWRTFLALGVITVCVVLLINFIPSVHDGKTPAPAPATNACALVASRRFYRMDQDSRIEALDRCLLVLLGVAQKP